MAREGNRTVQGRDAEAATRLAGRRMCKLNLNRAGARLFGLVIQITGGAAQGVGQAREQQILVLLLNDDLRPDKDQERLLSLGCDTIFSNSALVIMIAAILAGSTYFPVFTFT